MAMMVPFIWVGLVDMFCLPFYLPHIKIWEITVPDFIGRYYSNTARTVAVICALVVSFTYVAGQMRGVGLVFSKFLEVDINTGVIIGMIIVLFYARGMKGIIYPSSTVLRVNICFHGSCYLYFYQMTGNPVPQLGMGGQVLGSDTSIG
jgi:cation/acetate symporter